MGIRGLLVLTIFVGVTSAACGGTDETAGPTPLDTADIERGGALYDNWWEVARIDKPWSIPEPVGNHPLWDKRPDMTSNPRGGSITWKCTECHGWDYKGVDGKFGAGSHRTGFPGVYGTSLSAQEIFDLLGTGEHSFTGLGLKDQDRWDLTRFILEGLVETDDYVAITAEFSGDAARGQVLFTEGLGGKAACGGCHGDEGLDIPPLADQYFAGFLGKVASQNPWEALHKMQFGAPAVLMQGWYSVATAQDYRDLGAHLQTLPVGPDPSDP